MLSKYIRGFDNIHTSLGLWNKMSCFKLACVDPSCPLIVNKCKLPWICCSLNVTQK